MAFPPSQVSTEKGGNFQDLGLSRALLKGVASLNYLEPSAVQKAAIPVAMAGRDICACAATGSGKTAAFMLPVLERLLFRPKRLAQTRVLVLSPTRELAVQVCAVRCFSVLVCRWGRPGAVPGTRKDKKAANTIWRGVHMFALTLPFPLPPF